MSLDVAIVGLGYFSQFHLDAWSRCPETRLIGVVDADMGMDVFFLNLMGARRESTPTLGSDAVLGVIVSTFRRVISLNILKGPLRYLTKGARNRRYGLYPLFQTNYFGSIRERDM